MSVLLKSDNGQIVLRNIDIKDAEFLMELNNDRDISRFVVGNPKIVTLQEQLQWMNNLTNETDCKRFIVESNGEAVGTVIVSNINLRDKTANISIKLNKASHGKGIGKQSVCLLMKYCFEDLQLECLTARVLVYNVASLALFRSCGFFEEGVLRSRVVKENQRYDLVSFSKLKYEYSSK